MTKKRFLKIGYWLGVGFVGTVCGAVVGAAVGVSIAFSDYSANFLTQGWFRTAVESIPSVIFLLTSALVIWLIDKAITESLTQEHPSKEFTSQ